MSYDLNFWRYSNEDTRRTNAEHLALYHRLCEGKTSRFPELEELPVEDIRQQIGEELKEWAFGGSHYDKANAFWNRPGSPGASIEALFLSNWVRFDLRGDWTGDDANLLIDVLNTFDCPLFDPQVGEHGERYACS